MTGGQPNVSRLQFVRALHHSNKLCLNPLFDTTLCNITVRAAEKIILLDNLLLIWYVADTPEAEEVLGVKRGVNTYLSCHMCEFREDGMVNGSSDQPRTVQK